jgi:hypothetical protein
MNTEDHRIGQRIQMEADDIKNFFHKERITR